MRGKLSRRGKGSGGEGVKHTMLGVLPLRCPALEMGFVEKRAAAAVPHPWQKTGQSPQTTRLRWDPDQGWGTCSGTMLYASAMGPLRSTNASRHRRARTRKLVKTKLAKRHINAFLLSQTDAVRATGMVGLREIHFNEHVLLCNDTTNVALPTGTMAGDFRLLATKLRFSLCAPGAKCRQLLFSSHRSTSAVQPGSFVQQPTTGTWSGEAG